MKRAPARPRSASVPSKAKNLRLFGVTAYWSVEVMHKTRLACAWFANMRERKARAVLDEVKDAVAEWRRFAAEAGVSGEFADTIYATLNR